MCVCVYVWGGVYARVRVCLVCVFTKIHRLKVHDKTVNDSIRYTLTCYKNIFIDVNERGSRHWLDEIIAMVK